MTRYSKKSVEAHFEKIGKNIIKFCENDSNEDFENTLGFKHSYLALEVVWEVAQKEGVAGNDVIHRVLTEAGYQTWHHLEDDAGGKFLSVYKSEKQMNPYTTGLPQTSWKEGDVNIHKIYFNGEERHGKKRAFWWGITDHDLY